LGRLDGGADQIACATCQAGPGGNFTATTRLHKSRLSALAMSLLLPRITTVKESVQSSQRKPTTPIKVIPLATGRRIVGREHALLFVPSAIISLTNSPDWNVALNHRHPAVIRIERIEPFDPDVRLLGWGAFHQHLLYFASTSLMARTLSAERPFSSKVSLRKAPAISLASSTPMTRAPIVMICALFDSAALVAE